MAFKLFKDSQNLKNSDCLIHYLTTVARLEPKESIINSLDIAIHISSMGHTLFQRSSLAIVFRLCNACKIQRGSNLLSM